jgi:hypothetical protein
MTPEDDLRPLLATARELYGRVVYTHKTHEQEREIWSRQVSLMNRINIGLAGLTTCLAVLSASMPEKVALIATAISAGVTVCFTVWQTSSDPASKEAKNRVAAKELLWIREQLLLIITNCHISNYSQDHVQKSLEVITRELTAVYKFAPDTSPEAYGAADKMIKSGHFTFSDDEIDAMLPTELRKKKP